MQLYLKYYLLLLTLLVLGYFSTQAQVEQSESTFYSSMRSKQLPLTAGDTLQIDSLSILPESFTIIEVADSQYTLFPEQGYLVWKQKPWLPLVTLRYRTLALAFDRPVTHKEKNLVDSSLAFNLFKVTSADSFNHSHLQYNHIDYSGTYGRSLSLGNQQDVSLNSNFNMQLNGYLMDSIHVEAAVTDNNIPFQPDGNTQQIQEFDQIFIRFSKGRHRLVAGDYNLERPNSYFINFNKRVQGLLYQMDTSGNSGVKHKLGISGSIAKGQFARNVFQGIEGNQGPYKLTGNNGEQFFIVLAGSEKVFIDGQLLERGEDRDYVIDYNTAEVKFMPRRMITKDKRIQVEFEYQDRNYLNTLLFAYDEIQVADKWSLRLNAYSNQDSRNQPYTQSLSGKQKQFLASIGDDIDRAFYNTMHEDTFAANKILYKMIDTTVAGIIYDSVFVYSTNPDSARYQLGFSYVGEGKGHYILLGTNTNGRSYAWVAPVNGLPQGNYAPLALLVTPKMHQLFSLGTRYEIDSLKSVDLELSASNYSPNLFSKRDNHQHWGGAGKIAYSEKRLFGKKDSLNHNKFTLTNSLNYEYVHQQFRPIAPYRDVEFARDWNADYLEQPQDEHLAGFTTKLQLKQQAHLQYDFQWYLRGKNYKANRHELVFNYDDGVLKAGARASLMQANSDLLRSNYLRPSVFVEKKFKKLGHFSLGTRFESEKNSLWHQATDSLSLASFGFQKIGVYLRSAEDKKTQFNLEYSLRQDDSVRNNRFGADNYSQQVDAQMSLHQIKNQHIQLIGSYRQLKEQTPDPNVPPNSNSLLARLEYNGRIARGFIQPSLLYEMGSGQEQKRAYTYIEVPAGQGMYMWNDYNGDGLQQANEFEQALYPDQKLYIRILTPTNEYVRVNFVNFNQSIQLSPENLWTGKEKKTWQQFLSRFSDQLSLQISNRLLSATGYRGFNPFTFGFADSNIIANLSSISNSLYFNRSSSVWGVDYTFSKNTGKTLLSYGLESSAQQMHQADLRWMFAKGFTVQFDGRIGQRTLLSALADDGRSYVVDRKVVIPSLTWLLASTLRITGNYRWEQRQNSVDWGGERARIHSAELDARFSSRNWGSLQARGTYALIEYPYEANTPKAFVLLDALQPGSNWLWYLNWERRIGKGMEISLEYEGRKAFETAAVHSGRMSIRAIL